MTVIIGCTIVLIIIVALITGADSNSKCQHCAYRYECKNYSVPPCARK